jgi:hypothetical protein
LPNYKKLSGQPPMKYKKNFIGIFSLCIFFKNI